MSRSFLKPLLAASMMMAGSQQAMAQAAPRPVADASTRMNELGAENGRMAGRVGAWTVTETVWSAPGAPPKVTRGLRAERTMIGSILQEILRDPRDLKGTILRIDYLSFNRVEGRWEYVSMDPRAPVGIMTAQSQGRANGAQIALAFQPFALAGAGQTVTGQMLRMRQDISSGTPDHDTKDQYFTLADGSGTEWLAHRYDYTRR